MTTRPLHERELELLEQQIRKEKAEADVAEFEREAKYDAERDRQVKAGRIRHLWINDTIISPATEKWIEALQHWERRDPGQPVTIDIHSPGGSVTDGLAIFDQLQRMRRLGHHITIRGSGMVASMAAVLLQAGDERIMDARAKMMLHEGATTIGRDTTLTRAEQDDMRQFQDMLMADLLDILAERSTLSKRQIQTRWKRKDWWLTAQDAVRLGFADRVE